MPGVPLVCINICEDDCKKNKFSKIFLLLILTLLLSAVFVVIQTVIKKENKVADFDKITNLKSIHPDFTGRQHYFDKIENVFSAKKAEDVPVVVLFGEGGIGKSETAIAYANRNQEMFSLVYWIECDLWETYDQGYRNLAKCLHIPFQQKEPFHIIREKVHHYLRRSPISWLLIFDNAEKTLEFPSKGNGRILVTSRQEKLWHSFSPIRVLPFSEDEGLALMKSITKRRTTEEGQKELLERLNYFPLAVNQAAHYLAETPHMSEKDYVRLLSENQLKLLQNMPADSRYPYGLVASWQITIDRLKKRHPEAVEWLYFCSYLYPDAIPVSWIETWLSVYGDAKDPLQRELRASDILRTLIDFSFVRYDKKNETLSIHRLKQEIARSFAENIETMVAQFLAEEVKVLEGIRDIEQHHQDWPKLAVWEASSLWFLETSAPSYHSANTAEIENVLGNWNWMKADFLSAQKFHRLALATRKKLFGLDDFRVANSMNNLARVVERVGKFEEALDLHLSALRIRKKVFGDEHPDVATTLHHLSWINERLGNYLETKKLITKAFEMRKRLLGDEHPDVAYSLSDLAWVCHKLGEEKKAKKYAEDTLDMRIKLYGEEHPMVAASMNILGCVLREQNRTDKAIEFLEKALHMRKKLLGEEHPDIAITMYNLSFALKNRGSYKEAKKLSKCSLEQREKYFGKEHPYISDGLHLLGEIYLKEKDFKKAKETFNKAIEMKKKCYGEVHLKTAESIHSLASVFQIEGNYTQAIPLYQQSLRLRKMLFTEEHKDVAASLHQLALCFYGLKEYEAAMWYLLRAIHASHKVYRRDYVEEAQYLKTLVALLSVPAGQTTYYSTYCYYPHPNCGSPQPSLHCSLSRSPYDQSWRLIFCKSLLVNVFKR